MNGIEKRAGFYRGYLTHDRSLIPLTVVLGHYRWPSGCWST